MTREANKRKKAAKDESAPADGVPPASAEAGPAGSDSANGRGRPPKYRAEFAKQAGKLCELGATDRDLAEFFGVTTVTIWRWRSQHREFCNALKVGKGAPDDRVERSLYQRAVGYSYNSVKVMQHNGVPVYAEFIEHVPPDPGAAKLWLTNRRSEEWREKTYNEHAGKDGAPLIPVLNVTISRTESEASP
jgi:hypothetical protein